MRNSWLVLAFLPLAALANDERVEFAYRNPEARQEARTVVLQAKRDGAFRFDQACGATGAFCECLFLRSPNDLRPLRSAGAGLSSQNNTFSCTMAGAEKAERFPFVRVRLRSGAEVVAPSEIRTRLTLADVLGTLPTEGVREIHRYECSRTFLEGEGVSPASIACVAGQRLGLISAKYRFYLYRDAFGGNQRGSDQPFPSSICGRNDLLQSQCLAGPSELRYGLYREARGQFVVGISMTRAPMGDGGGPLFETYGYAALPDSAGHCPPGLMPVRPWTAQPASITRDSLGRNPPSSFVNQLGSLNDTVVEAERPANFHVSRWPNREPCAANGDCTNARFGAQQTAQSVRYAALAPTVCVVPPGLIGQR